MIKYPFRKIVCVPRFTQGFVIDSENLSVQITEEKRSSLTNLVTKFVQNPVHSLREFSQLIGKLVAACPGVDYGWLYLKEMETFRDKSLLKSKLNYDVQITIPSDLLPDLTWWQKSIKYAESSFKNGQYEKTIYTDASDSGWGATDGINKDYGFWDLNQKKWHLNYKELMVIKIALQKLVNNAKNCQILLRVDNMTAIAYVNKMGGTRFPNLHALAKEIWQWAERKNIFLFASYIPSRENVEADALSRIANDDTEWELADTQFNKIIKTFGQVDIDLFATNHNTKEF